MIQKSIAQSDDVPGWRVFVRTLAASWISLASIVIGYFAFIGVTESQDLLLDVRKWPSEGIIFWTGVFLCTYFLWPNMVRSAARLAILQRMNYIGINSQYRLTLFTSILPKIYVFVVYLIVFCGIVAALENMPGNNEGGDPYATLAYVIVCTVLAYSYFRYAFAALYRLASPHAGKLAAFILGLAAFLVLRS